MEREEVCHKYEIHGLSSSSTGRITAFSWKKNSAIQCRNAMTNICLFLCVCVRERVCVQVQTCMHGRSKDKTRVTFLSSWSSWIYCSLTQFLVGCCYCFVFVFIFEMVSQPGTCHVSRLDWWPWVRGIYPVLCLYQYCSSYYRAEIFTQVIRHEFRSSGLSWEPFRLAHIFFF